MWLADRLNVPVRRLLSAGPGLTAVRMETDCGPVALDRADGSLATLAMQGQPDRNVALKRRDTAELLAEELRRLDPDDTYASTLKYGVDRLGEPERAQTPLAARAAESADEPVTSAADAAEATDSAEAKSAAKAKAPAKKSATKKADSKAAPKADSE